MELNVKFFENNKANGICTLNAFVYYVAKLSWANINRILDDWLPFAYMPLDANSKGKFHLQDCRSIPPQPTHIHVQVINDDFLDIQECLFKIQLNNYVKTISNAINIYIISDFIFLLKHIL